MRLSRTRTSWKLTTAPAPLVIAVCMLVGGCFSYPPDRQATGQVGGRVLLAPGTGLASAQVVVTQVDLYDGAGGVRKTVGTVTTDADGNFAAQSTGTINGLLLLEARGGTYTDPINGARIELDSSVHLRAIHWLGIFEDRSTTAWITPIHALVESRFREKNQALKDPIAAASAAYAELDQQFGGLDWEKVIPADLTQPATSPTDAVRAAFVLGGLSLLADDVRQASQSSPQVVGLTTLVAAMATDLADGHLDGNDDNDAATGSGLQVGDCPPVDSTCVAPSTGCALGACRSECDLYANTYRTTLGDSISKFIGLRAFPTTWNKTGLGSEDVRTLIDGVARNPDDDLFGTACIDTQHRAPPSILWEVAPTDGALVSGLVTVRVRAVDTEGNRAPSVSFDHEADTDGDPSNDVATATIDTTLAMDGPLQVAVTAVGTAGNTARATRTFDVDNTKPSVTLDATGFFVDANGAWWTATPTPALSGLATDTHGVTSVQIQFDGTLVATANVSDAHWSVQLPALPPSGAAVTAIAVNQASNAASVTQSIRLDTTPPSVSVTQSIVHDESLADFSYQDTPSPVITHTSNGAPVDLASSTGGSCPTIHKYAHLLFANHVLGSAGDPNSLILNVVVTDDGVGIHRDSTRYRVSIHQGGSNDPITPWILASGDGPTYAIPLYRDAIPQLGTTHGEYHVEIQAADNFGRTTTQEVCWNHVVLAPPLRFTTPSNGGEIASGFPQALWSASLDPVAGQTADFAEKFLNPDAANQAGLAVWRARFKNYLGMPVYMKVEIPRPPGDLSATVHREFKVVHSLANFRQVNRQKCPGQTHCLLTSTAVVYDSPFNPPMTQSGLQLRAHLFVMNGNNTDHEFSCAVDDPGPGCVTSADDPTQTYVFTIPARTAQQGNSPPEYGVLTNLLPTLPAGSGTNVTMAPSDGTSPDPGPFGEFTFSGATLTGKLVPGTIFTGVCTDEDAGDLDGGEDPKSFYCTQRADGVEYRALAKIQFQPNNNLITMYSFAAQPSLPYSPLGDGTVGILSSSMSLTTSEPVLP